MESSKETQKSGTSLHRQQQAEFVENLENLFDIAHADALSMIKIPEDRQHSFWLKGRKADVA